jgi:predicted transcriptional regulator
MVTATFKLSEDDYNKLSEIARKDDRPISGMMRLILRGYMKQRESSESEDYEGGG